MLQLTGSARIRWAFKSFNCLRQRLQEAQGSLSQEAGWAGVILAASPTHGPKLRQMMAPATSLSLTMHAWLMRACGAVAASDGSGHYRFSSVLT